MNKNISNTSIKRAWQKIPLLLLAVLLLSSCEEKIVQEDPFFSIEGDPTGLTATVKAKTASYVVRSNRHWDVVKQGDSDWVKAFPAKGDDDGIFKIIVDANPTFYTRTENFAFVVDGEEQPVLFRVDQEANVPYITMPDTVTVLAAGGEFTVSGTANVPWNYSLDNGSWLTEVGTTATSITFNATENTSIDKRYATLTVTSIEFPTVSATVTLAQSAGTVVLEENFSWLEYGSAVFYTTTGETRYDNWTQEQKDMGWVSEVSPIATAGGTPLCYARQGFVKLGKTGYGGDLYSPALSKITGTTDVLVTFKAVPYMTATGTKDDNYLNIFVIGPGTISQSQFVIDNWPVYPAESVEAYCIGMWSAPEATRSFTITGATAETKIKFLGGDYDLVGVGAGKNRIFLDDIKVEIILP
jgi:hypothetical protein